jgi:hypothetical protein
MEDEFEDIENGERFESWAAIEAAVTGDRMRWCPRARPDDLILVLDDEPEGTGFIQFDHGTHTTEIDFEDFVPIHRSYTRKAQVSLSW